MRPDGTSMAALGSAAADDVVCDEKHASDQERPHHRALEVGQGLIGSADVTLAHVERLAGMVLQRQWCPTGPAPVQHGVRLRPIG
jgi:hypothetical protein